MLSRGVVVLVCLAAAARLSSAGLTRYDSYCPQPEASIVDGTDMQKACKAFDYSPRSSRRHFNEIHWYSGDPNLTLGVGHFATTTVCSFFAYLLEHAEQTVLGSMYATMDLDDKWADLFDDAGLPATSSKNYNTFRSAVKKLFCVGSELETCFSKVFDKWQDKRKSRFNYRGFWFFDGWRVASLRKAVAKLQMEYWRINFLYEGEKRAHSRNIHTIGGYTSLASAKSSSSSHTVGSSNTVTLETNQAQIDAKCPGFVNQSWSWPFKTGAPSDVLPAGTTFTDSQKKKVDSDWRSLVAWQYYQAARVNENIRKGGKHCSDATKRLTSNRDRMVPMWNLWFKKAWGDLPAEYSPTFRPKHSATQFMDDRSYKNFKVNEYMKAESVTSRCTTYCVGVRGVLGNCVSSPSDCAKGRLVVPGLCTTGICCMRSKSSAKKAEGCVSKGGKCAGAGYCAEQVTGATCPGKAETVCCKKLKTTSQPPTSGTNPIMPRWQEHVRAEQSYFNGGAFDGAERKPLFVPKVLDDNLLQPRQIEVDHTYVAPRVHPIVDRILN